MLRAWAVLLGFQLVGELVARLLQWPVPGPVLGMLLLLAALELRLPRDEPLVTVSSGLLSHLSLLFVPAGVGVMLHAARLAAEWQALVAAVLVSTVAAIGVTGWIADRLLRRHAGTEEAPS
ncbi:CidA/LrgA family protein [Anaeromyxobacter sp. Fw109-5]|uniref:CidA/LrgA family protein n=1 Tax=Anaeromyxobacter sp. (strain Fw109-5) TaxID=404589 RepID=UPI0002F69F8F|nr:CidA/LrgA family protein [Anaeromyxobacter sp. Fw109-5]